MKTHVRIVEYRVVQPNGSPNGYGWDDRTIETFHSYEQAEEYIGNETSTRSLRIDKVFVLEELPF